MLRHRGQRTASGDEPSKPRVRQCSRRCA